MDCVDSPEVHAEIRQLAVREKQRVAATRQLNEEALLPALRQYGPAVGAQKMLDKEMEAALHAIAGGTYIVLRSTTGQECTRVGPSHRCFCSHTLGDHNLAHRRVPCAQCGCDAFQYMFERPEEIGEYWLVRRKDFNILTWAPKCRCKHTHKEHHPHKSKACRRCGCGSFQSDFLCLVCDRHWEDHETVVETAAERRAAGRPVGEAFRPLAEVAPEFSDIVFGKQNAEGVYVRQAPTPAQRALTRTRPAVPVKKGPPRISNGDGAPPSPRLVAPPSSSSSAPSSAPSSSAPGTSCSHCSACRAPFAPLAARFCSSCGAKRQ